MEFQFTRKHVLWVLINLICLSGYESCLFEERLGLLSIRDYLESNGVRTEKVFPSWTDNLSSNCCSWERVKCNSTTGRVIELHLSNTRLAPDSFVIDRRIWYLNVSLFLPFEELHNLDLHGNWFTDCYKNHGFEKISSLKKLEVLDLTKNHFQNDILQSLAEITSLRTLDLSSNRFEGSFRVNELKAMEHLKMLDLSYNELSDLPMVQDFKLLKDLIVLNLKGNRFNSNILPFVSTLTSLKTLNLAANNFGATIAATELDSLENLEQLDLSYNDLNVTSIVDGLSRLQKLAVLNLAGNHITKSSLKSLGAITSLKNLYLASCQLDGVFPAQDLASLKNLEILDLSGNFLNGSLTMLADLAAFKKLQILDLSNNHFSGNFFQSLGHMTSLKTLSLAGNYLNGSLAGNHLNGSLAQEGLCALKNIQELDLSYNNLSGIIPPCLGNLASLRILDLSSNTFEGDISSSPIATLRSLEYIDLRNNLFWGKFSFYSISNHTNLKVLMLSSDNHKLEVQNHYSHDLLPRCQLKILVMSNCRLNNIPQFLTHQIDLRVVDLSHNNLTGTFPNWLLENNTRIVSLSLRNNSFVGPFHLSSNSSFVIRQIDISLNHFHGQLQQNIDGIIPNIEMLNLSANAFEGGIPFSIGNMPYLFFLDLCNNKFSGEVPDNLLTNSSNLVYLLLANNGFTGQIPKTKSNITSLLSLLVSGNQFTGSLSNWISHYPTLHYVDLSGNFISGEIPGFIGNLTLYHLNIADNMLEGTIPCELSTSRLSFLDISYNNISGTLSSCLKWPSYIMHLNLEGNGFVGTIPEFFNSSYMMTLNVGNNFLSGEIPTLGNLSHLRVFHLGGNSLSGLIPEQLCQLNELRILDLSRNSFTGPIPDCFSNIAFGKVSTFDFAEDWMLLYETWEWESFDSFRGNLKHKSFPIGDMYAFAVQRAHVNLVTKTRFDIYRGRQLELMSGLDLSCNQLTGEIPAELGNLSWLHTLNLSHNQLTGSIPRTFENFRQIESLDLSHNKLSGEIPFELLSLHFLSYFCVAYNNLSGRLPELKGQFATFDGKSYEGNPFLCGPPLDTSCRVDVPQLPPPSDGSKIKWHDILPIDPVSFSASFAAAYFIFLLGFAAVLYVNPHWRQRLFLFIDNVMDKCHFLVRKN